MILNKYQPYTYLIRFKPTGQLYYGCSTSIGCSPDDLWVRYFTSSKIVKGLIAEHGADSFEIVSIKLHETREDALKWEELYLVSVQAAQSNLYLNKSNGAKNFVCNGHTEETRIKMRKSHLGEANINYKKSLSKETRDKISKKLKGNVISEETKKKISEKLIGRIVSDETKQKHTNSQLGEKNHMWGKFGENNPNSKKYIIIFPDGHEEFIICMAEFCKNNSLDASNMLKVILEKQSSHKGFKCRYATEQEILDNQPKILHNSTSKIINEESSE